MKGCSNREVAVGRFDGSLFKLWRNDSADGGNFEFHSWMNILSTNLFLHANHERHHHIFRSCTNAAATATTTQRRWRRKHNVKQKQQPKKAAVDNNHNNMRQEQQQEMTTITKWDNHSKARQQQKQDQTMTTANGTTIWLDNNSKNRRQHKNNHFNIILRQQKQQKQNKNTNQSLTKSHASSEKRDFSNEGLGMLTILSMTLKNPMAVGWKQSHKGVRWFMVPQARRV